MRNDGPYSTNAEILTTPFSKDKCIARLRKGISSDPLISKAAVGEVDDKGQLIVFQYKGEWNGSPCFMRLVADIEDKSGTTTIHFRVTKNRWLYLLALFLSLSMFTDFFGKNIGGTSNNTRFDSTLVTTFVFFSAFMTVLAYAAYHIEGPKERDYLISWLKDVCVPGWNAKKLHGKPDTDEMVPKDWRDSEV